MSATLHPEVDHLPAALLVRVGGEIDLANAAAVRGELGELARRHRPACLVADLGAVSYLDSSGIELLFLLAGELAREETVLSVVAPSGAPAARVLSMAALDDVAPVHESVDAALGACRPT